jgi:glycosyltransferase involved in cell wall biosynthesis
MAAEGIQVSNGENCWLEDDPAGFASRVVKELREPGSAITGRAKESVLAHNSIPAAAPRFEKLAQRAVHIKRKRPYKLLFDLRWMKIGRAGGTEQMSYELIAAISRLDHRNEYRILCPRSTFYEWKFPQGFRCRSHFADSNEAKFEALRAGLSNLLATSIGRQPLLTPEMRALRWYNRLDFDLVHSLCGYILPEMQSFPNILTVHDLQHIHYPEFFTPTAWQGRDDLYRAAARLAVHITCVSEFTRMDLHRHYGIPLHKMTTVWNIPSRAAWAGGEAGGRAGLLGRLGLKKPFLFYPAHCWPHKNHRRLIEAFKMAASELPSDIQLVLAGRDFEEHHPARQLIAAEGLDNRVVHLGYRSTLEMRALYRGAHALVFPSLFEGFGMPVAEALLAGCPVACSHSTSLPEIGGDAVSYFDPRKTEDIARAMVEITTDEKLRTDLLAAARRRTPLFSARRAAVKALSVYHRVFEEVYAT